MNKLIEYAVILLVMATVIIVITIITPVKDKLNTGYIGKTCMLIDEPITVIGVDAYGLLITTDGSKIDHRAVIDCERK